MRRAALAFGLLSALGAGSAYAHEAPQGIALVWPRASDTVPVVLTNRGLVFATESAGTTTFSVRCNEAYGVNTAEVPDVWADERGQLVLSTSSAVSTTADRGCSFVKSTGLPELSLGAAAEVPSQPGRKLVPTIVYDEPGQLFVSDDHGRSWKAQSSTVAMTAYAKLVTSADGQRIYASGDRFDVKSGKLVQVWASSSDGGKTFGNEDVSNARVPLGVHPLKPELVLARERIEPAGELPYDRLVRSRDAGRTWEVVRELTSTLATFTATPDGRQLWVGGEMGLLTSTDDGAHFEPVAADEVVAVRCLYYRQDKLWACANMAPNTYGVWSSDDRGSSWTEILTFARVTEPVSCPRDVARTCDLPWQDWSRELLTGASADAGMTRDGGVADASTSARDAGASDEDDEEPTEQTDSRKSADGGCHLADPRRDLAPLALLLSLLALRRRRAVR